MPGALSRWVDAARSPTAFLTERLAKPAAPSVVFLTLVTPLAAIRPVALFLRSLFGGTPMPGVVLGLSSFALQIGTWLAICLVLPALARQFSARVGDRQAFALISYAMVPIWLAGPLFAVPEEPALLQIWSRMLLAIIAGYGIFLTHRGLVALEVSSKVRLPLLAGITVATAVTYGVLSLLLGIGAHIALLVVT